MNMVSKIYYTNQRLMKFPCLLMLITGSGIVGMVTDNNAGIITTYTATGAKYGFNLTWFLIF